MFYFRKITITVIFLSIFLSGFVIAEYVGGKNPIMIFGNNTIKFGVEQPPTDTCSYYGRQFRFDASTANGKNMLSMLLAAKMADKPIDIWYTPSTRPETDHTSGCTVNDLAVINEIGIR